MPYSYVGLKEKETSYISLRGIEPTALAQGGRTLEAKQTKASLCLGL